MTTSIFRDGDPDQRLTFDDPTDHAVSDESDMNCSWCIHGASDDDVLVCTMFPPSPHTWFPAVYPGDSCGHGAWEIGGAVVTRLEYVRSQVEQRRRRMQRAAFDAMHG